MSNTKCYSFLSKVFVDKIFYKCICIFGVEIYPRFRRKRLPIKRLENFRYDQIKKVTTRMTRNDPEKRTKR